MFGSKFEDLSPIGLILFASISALAYDMLKGITANKFVIIAIGIALMLFTTGSLQTVGLGITALGVSRLIEKEVVKLESS